MRARQLLPAAALLTASSVFWAAPARADGSEAPPAAAAPAKAGSSGDRTLPSGAASGGAGNASGSSGNGASGAGGASPSAGASGNASGSSGNGTSAASVAASPARAPAPPAPSANPAPATPGPVTPGPAAPASGSKDDAPYGRVSFLEGDLFVRGPFDAEEQNLTLNSIIREGDVVRVAENARGELELPGETFVRLGANTSLKIEKIARSVVVSLTEGVASVSHGRRGGDALLTAKLGGVGLGPGAVVRADVARGDQTFTLRGVAGTSQATCRDKSAKLARGEALTCSSSDLQRGQWDPAKGDAFDRWTAERETHASRTADVPPVLSGEYEGLADLEGNGTWINEDDGWYWQPTVVAADWRPYYDGYWSWYQPIGWTWVSYAPWGFVTHHYGRWLWRGGLGWVWSPAPVFGGAWVVWGTFGGAVGWAPCDFWGHPINAWSYHTYYDHRAWTFGSPHYFATGGGNYIARSYWQTHPQVTQVVSASGHTNPIYTMSNNQLAQLHATPVHDPHVAFAPQSASAASFAGARTVVAHAGPVNASRPTLGGALPNGGGSLLPHLAAAESATVRAGPQSSATPVSSLGVRPTTLVTHPAAGAFANRGVPGAGVSQARVNEFNRWSNGRALNQRAANERAIWAGAGAGGGSTSAAGAARVGSGFSGYQRAANGRIGAFGGSARPPQVHSVLPTTSFAPAGSMHIARPSGGGIRGGGGGMHIGGGGVRMGGGGRHR